MFARRLLFAGLFVVFLSAACFWRPVAAENVTVSAGVGDTVVQMEGYASPGALVTFLRGVSVVGTVTANLLGEYSYTLVNQPPGIQTYQVFAEDTQQRLTDTVALSVSVQEFAQTTVSVFLPPTIEVSDNEVVAGTPIVLRGATVPLAQLVLVIDGESRTLSADASGAWHYTLDTSSLGAGEHQFYMIAVKPGGGQSQPSHIRTLIIHNKQVPTPEPEPSPGPTPSPTVPLPEEPATSTVPGKPRITNPQSGYTTTNGWVQLCGRAEPGAQIEIWNRQQLVASTFADSEGNWCVKLYLTDFTNLIKVRACKALRCSAFSSAIKVFRERPAAVGDLRALLNAYRFRALTHEVVALTAQISGGKRPYLMRVDWGDGEKTELNNANLRQLVTHRYKQAGRYKGVVTISDEKGNQVQLHFSVAVSAPVGPIRSWLTAYLIPVVIASVIGTSAIFLAPRIGRWIRLKRA